jgi:hypothetical protein
MTSFFADTMFYMYDTKSNKETPKFFTTNKQYILETLTRESNKNLIVYEYHYIPGENCFIPKYENYVAAYQYIDGDIRVLRK